jgi:hypothetical protein
MEEEKNEEFIRNLAEDYKNILEEKDKKIRKLARQHNHLFKILCVVYSIFRQLDAAFDKIEFPVNSIFKAIHDMVEYGRAEASRGIHGYLPEEEESGDEL